MKFQIEVTTVIDLAYDPAQYPEGTSPQQALDLKLEELSRDPRKLRQLDAQLSEIRGTLVQDGDDLKTAIAGLVSDADGGGG